MLPRFKVQDGVLYTMRLVNVAKPTKETVTKIWSESPCLYASPIYHLEVDGVEMIYFTKSKQFASLVSKTPQQMMRIYDVAIKQHRWMIA